MNGSIFIAHGDITQLAAHAIAFSTSTTLGGRGDLYPAFAEHIPTFAEQYAPLRAAGPFNIGDTFWLPLGGPGRPHGVVVVPAAGGPVPPSPDEKAQFAVRAAIERAVRELRSLTATRDRRLLVALPAFQTGQGSHQDERVTSARRQIQAARAVLERLERVDVAFITYTPQIYQIYLEARRQEFGAPPGPPQAHSSARYPDLEAALRQNECVLFIGAGLSFGSDLPDWKTLIEQLARELKIQPGPHLDFLDVAQWYNEAFGPERLARLIRELFGNTERRVRPTLAHYLLMSLPIRYVITTNYDELLETSLTALRRPPIRIIHPADIARTGQGEGTYIVKFHGDAAEAADLVLTRDDYAAFFTRRPAMASLLEGLLLNQTFFFVGYSLRDPNFRAIYERIGQMVPKGRRPAFATSFDVARDTWPYFARQWANHGLDLIGIPGDTQEEQEYQLLCFLDRLTDRVFTQTARLFLAGDVDLHEECAPMQQLLRTLREDVGRQVIDTIAELARPEYRGHPHLARDVRFLAALLEFLTHHSWRPSPAGTQFWRQWLRLASRGQTRAERRRMVTLALRHTGRSDQAQTIYQHLAELEQEESSATEETRLEHG